MSYYMKLSRIEFVITNTCSGRCKHCSCGERPDDDGINVDLAVDAVKKLSKRFSIESVMTFGGEPLLFADTVAKIHAAARDCGILNRQIITNGFFATDGGETDKVAKLLCDSGINDILLSIDAFHQEFIPLDPVVQFAEALLSYGVPSLQVHPAWVVNEAADNHYNAETKRLLKIFADKGINATEGNNIFPSGNALKYLAEFFPPPGKVDLSAPCGSAPYTSRLDEVDCISINPDGGVYVCSEIGNIYNDDILYIIDGYDPCKIPILRAVLDGGVAELSRYAESKGIAVDVGDCRSVCGACRKIRAAITESYREEG